MVHTLALSLCLTSPSSLRERRSVLFLSIAAWDCLGFLGSEEGVGLLLVLGVAAVPDTLSLTVYTGA